MKDGMGNSVYVWIEFLYDKSIQFAAVVPDGEADSGRDRLHDPQEGGAEEGHAGGGREEDAGKNRLIYWCT